MVLSLKNGSYSNVKLRIWVQRRPEKVIELTWKRKDSHKSKKSSLEDNISIWELVGMKNCYRQHVSNFVYEAKPLHNLITRTTIMNECHDHWKISKNTNKNGQLHPLPKLSRQIIIVLFSRTSITTLLPLRKWLTLTIWNLIWFTMKPQRTTWVIFIPKAGVYFWIIVHASELESSTIPRLPILCSEVCHFYISQSLDIQFIFCET